MTRRNPPVGPLEYDPATNRHSGIKLVRGDVLRDSKGFLYSLDRDLGFSLNVDELRDYGHGFLERSPSARSFHLDAAMKRGRYAFTKLYAVGVNIFDTPKSPALASPPARPNPLLMTVTANAPRRSSGRRSRRNAEHYCAWCTRAYGDDGAPYGPKGASLDKESHGICSECRAEADPGGAASTKQNPDRGQDGYRFIRAYGYSGRGEWRWALWERVRGHLRRVGTAKTRDKAERFLMGDQSYVQDLATARTLRPNPTLMLVTANPPSGAVERVKAAWAKFHHHAFNGAVRRLPSIPGGPSVVFALGECVALDFGTGDARPKGRRPLVCCDPSDDSLWLVAQGGGLNLAKCSGMPLHALTYAPVRSSGKEDADFRHEFDKPHPRLKPIGRAAACKAALLDGGRYFVRDWIYE